VSVAESGLGSELAALLRRATEIEAALASDDGAVAEKLNRSLIRPLSEALGGNQRHPRPGHLQSPTGEALLQLARDVTKLRLAPGAPAEVQEAAGAMQDLAYRFAPDEQQQLEELRALHAELPQAIQCMTDGPYLVTNAERLTIWLGDRLPTRPQMALCRCGESKDKPFCDGSHAEVGWGSEKDPNRVPDRLDTYTGQQVTILDNRGTCQHSGFCTDRLATVFRLNEEPFVAPSGGQMDELMRAVRDCPSGALSYAIDGSEAREEVDWHGTREPAIEVSKDGPYRVTDEIALRDGHGRDQPRNAGASREHYALCRCGHSQNKPFYFGLLSRGGTYRKVLSLQGIRGAATTAGGDS
jgi:CDGSH-type Zn-finger protein/ferredoxin